VAHGRYRRFLAFWNASPLKDMDGEGLFVPKMHAVLHLLEFLVLFGAVDNARLGDQEKDHRQQVRTLTWGTRTPTRTSTAGRGTTPNTRTWPCADCYGTT